ncbi:hypothetical protein C404_00280 [Ralstonia sp. AU12-08]|nr:hypothetical protein C404_00280 [Ralstonia sp. AU12-08]
MVAINAGFFLIVLAVAVVMVACDWNCGSTRNFRARSAMPPTPGAALECGRSH